MTSGIAQLSTPTDLGGLWNQAIKDYHARTGGNLPAMGAKSMDEVLQSTDAAMKRFKGFRDDGSKMSRFRSSIGNYLGDIQKCIDGFEVIGAAAGAFPPAMPVGLVFTAASRLISAFAGVKADYDRVEEFFAYSARFFERLSILESRAQSGPLAIAIVRVFSMQLSVCGRVEHLIKEKRFSQWLNALWNMEDKELVEAYAAMQASIDELDEAVGYESYSSIRAVQDNLRSGNDKLDSVKEDMLASHAKLSELDAKLMTFRSSLGQNIQQVYASSLKLETVVSEGFVAVQAKQDESYAILMQIQKSMEKRKGGSKHEESKKLSAGTKGDVGEGKFQALREIKKFFTENSPLFPSWTNAHRKNMTQNKNMESSRIQHTGEWLGESVEVQSWVNGGNPLLWLIGGDGIGKSFLSFSMVQRLRASQNEQDSTAYFYFREEHPYSQSVQNAFASAALQIAESNSKYAEQVASSIRNASNKTDNLPTWRRFFFSLFPGSESSSGRLFLILDGLDEAQIRHQGTLSQFLSGLKMERPNVSVLMTSRYTETPELQLHQPSILNITKEHVRSDIKLLTRSRLSSLPRVRKFNASVKRVITRKVVGKADSMLYAENILRRFSHIGRERAVLESLAHLPSDLQDLYQLFLHECGQNRTDAQYKAMKTMFAWLAFSKRSLSLAEASNLLQFKLPDGSFDIEEEVIGRSSRILELNQAWHRDEDGDDNDNDDGSEDDFDDDDEENDNLDNVEVHDFEYQSSPLSFQDRSLRQYFRDVSAETTGETEFRTPAAAAHLTILQICVEIMMKAAKDTEYQQNTKLSDYATKYWYEHLKELNPEDVTKEVLQQVVTILYNITQNTNNIAKLFEKLTRIEDVYPQRTKDSTVSWFDMVLIWASKALSLPDGCLTEDVKNWARTVDRTNVLLPLASGHVQNWLEADDQLIIPETFRFVKASLSLMDLFEATESQPLKTIQSVVTQFALPAENYKTLRAIGSTLCDYGYEVSDPDKRKSMLSDGATYLKQAVDCIEGDSVEKSATLFLLAPKYRWTDRFPDAIRYFSQADKLLAEMDLANLSPERKKRVKDLHLEIKDGMAEVYALMGHDDLALETYNQARSLSGQESLAGWMLDDITMIWNPENDVDGSKLMETLESWSDKERNSWFTYCFEDWVDLKAVTRMQRAAKLTNKTDLLLVWLNKLAKTLSNRSVHFFNIRNAIASLHYPVLRDMNKGKSTRQEILEMKTRSEMWYEETFEEQQTQRRLELADILYHEFHMSPDPMKKMNLIDTMRLLPSAHKDDDNPQESHIRMIHANMLQIMGPATEYQKYMNELFATCIRGLEDGISWNDTSSLRLLSKVLAPLEGLEKDARIAFSAQFSILNRVIYDQSVSSESSEHTSNSNNGVCNETSAEEGVEATVVKPSDLTEGGVDEDITKWDLTCNADCGTRIASWTEPFFYCLICSSCNLCEKCHSRRQAQTRGEIAEPWRTFCGDNHRYIKGPMKGWKGVKNGIIRIGDEEFQVQEWLRGLKEERWDKAWKIFWTRQGGLKDIDD